MFQGRQNMKTRILLIMIAAMLFGRLAAAAAAVEKQELTGADIINEIQRRFIAQDIKTMSYDELRVHTYEMTRGTDSPGTMPLSMGNGTTLKMRYFYQAPGKHGYKLLSKTEDNYWAGSPNEPGAIAMDHGWTDKVFNSYNVERGPDKVFKGIDCFRVTLIPKSVENKIIFPMTWYIDKERYIVLKFLGLVNSSDMKVSINGVIDYEKMNDYWFPVSSKWKTKVSKLPYTFINLSTYTNYRFNIPLAPSVFTEEFPPNWFENLGEKPYIQQK